MERYNIYIVILCIFAVTSLAEVWIEIKKEIVRGLEKKSLPLRKCGLKFSIIINSNAESHVTSLAEVWIEILK